MIVLWTIPLTYMQSHSYTWTLPPTNRVFSLLSAADCLVLLVEHWDSARICWPSLRSGLVPEIQSQLNCSSSRERDSGTLSSSFPSNCLRWVLVSWQLAIGWTGSPWWLGTSVCVGVYVAVCYRATDHDCFPVWCMSFFRSECEWMDVITVFTMARFKMDYFQ